MNETWVDRIHNGGVEKFAQNTEKALNHYGSAFREWCMERIHRKDLPLAIAAVEQIVEIMKSAELNDVGRDLVEIIRQLTMAVAVPAFEGRCGDETVGE